jgi:beta-lactam-binding protein with PASTA domain
VRAKQQVVCLLGGLLALAAVAGCSSDTAKVANVVGMSERTAEHVLHAEHLRVEQVWASSSRKPGLVVAQSPAPGAGTPKNSTAVVLTVSAYPGTV